MNQSQVDALAESFASALADTLGPTLFQSMRTRNVQNIDTGVCASHDHCDANQVMLDAFAYVMQRDADLASDADMASMDAAWCIARRLYLTAAPIARRDTSIDLHNRAMRHLINVAAACQRADTCNGHAAARRAYDVALAHAAALIR